MNTKNFGRFDEPFENKDFLTGLLAGAALGIVAGILLAPRSGKHTIDKIAGAAKGHAEELESEWNDTEDKVRKNWDKVSNKAHAITNEAENKFEEFAGQAEDKASEVSKESSSIVDRLKSRFEKA